MADWWLEGLDGSLHRALFTQANIDDARKMKWTSGLHWSKEVRNPQRLTYKLVHAMTGTILGAISLSDEGDHVFIHLMESAPQTRYGITPPRFFINVPRLLVAFAGMKSNQLGYSGFLALTPKTNRRDYFEKQFKAEPVYGRNMAIHGVVSNHWITVYYK
ncbi:MULTISPECIES: hypothetical protein [unclassified Paenibacillus]|uniref:hypothetical protein n=1 Tax=unclassified Paenibacillus TaxID=185978 RepID=UPI002404D102|nr:MULTISPECIES: hypothetical protein [unclassified Paenibacillus]MDF9842493.1 hypothetical protein [Paenibacillus sp. PastF-2]MDF9849083.1 hypothetical protein [Paenibacillus sp. PastM-2]MDF9855653.1 hypothetical protein [Paenibacillus sp. PastF-1]MDH6480925.1 hypothetical protein [Paenibacillus sp. PastH-2]MDH6508347.1 hypothetical protein [Paenibacillus sp. PastM-3]